MYILEDILAMIFSVSQSIVFHQLWFRQLLCCDRDGRFLGLVVLLGAVARLGEAGDICGVFGDSEGCCQDSKSSGEEWQLSMAGSDCGINTAAVESDNQ